MKHFKILRSLTAAFVMLATLGALLALTSSVFAQSVSREDRLNDKTSRLFVWQLERDGITITRADRLYLVVNGDTWKSIADSYGLTVEKLQGANPQVKDTSILFRGELLHIPTGSKEVVPLFYRTAVVSTSQ
jgi:hypothetical protein